jgi:uncharacterized protein YcgL (UPF0745 family)
MDCLCTYLSSCTFSLYGKLRNLLLAPVCCDLSSDELAHAIVEKVNKKCTERGYVVQLSRENKISGVKTRFAKNGH